MSLLVLISVFTISRLANLVLRINIYSSYMVLAKLEEERVESNLGYRSNSLEEFLIDFHSPLSDCLLQSFISLEDEGQEIFDPVKLREHIENITRTYLVGMIEGV
jgi:hypothetical protein